MSHIESMLLKASEGDNSAKEELLKWSKQINSGLALLPDSPYREVTNKICLEKQKKEWGGNVPPKGLLSKNLRKACAETSVIAIKRLLNVGANPWDIMGEHENEGSSDNAAINILFKNGNIQYQETNELISMMLDMWDGENLILNQTFFNQLSDENFERFEKMGFLWANRETNNFKETTLFNAIQRFVSFTKQAPFSDENSDDLSSWMTKAVSRFMRINPKARETLYSFGNNKATIEQCCIDALSISKSSSTPANFENAIKGALFFLEGMLDEIRKTHSENPIFIDLNGNNNGHILVPLLFKANIFHEASFEKGMSLFKRECGMAGALGANWSGESIKDVIEDYAQNPSNGVTGNADKMKIKNALLSTLESALLSTVAHQGEKRVKRTI